MSKKKAQKKTSVRNTEMPQAPKGIQIGSHVFKRLSACEPVTKELMKKKDTERIFVHEWCHEVLISDNATLSCIAFCIYETYWTVAICATDENDHLHAVVNYGFTDETKAKKFAMIAADNLHDADCVWPNVYVN